LDIEDITDEEAEALWSSETFRENDALLKNYESAEQLKKYSGVTGKKYYSISYGGFWITGFERINGTFENSEYEILCPYHDDEIYAVGIDIDKAQAEMIRLEK
ncbi:MAG: hypothetical protein K2K44_01565, partial [Oscillospiraceae bacterium]|nr:hypothetical protein [Oscillospiraceae bacterium]